MSAPPEKIWDSERQRRNKKLARAALALGAALRDKVVPADRTVTLLEAVIEPEDRVCMEGNNQKQADKNFALFKKNPRHPLAQNRFFSFVPHQPIKAIMGGCRECVNRHRIAVLKPKNHGGGKLRHCRLFFVNSDEQWQLIGGSAFHLG